MLLVRTIFASFAALVSAITLANAQSCDPYYIAELNMTAGQYQINSGYTSDPVLACADMQQAVEIMSSVIELMQQCGYSQRNILSQISLLRSTQQLAVSACNPPVPPDMCVFDPHNTCK